MLTDARPHSFAKGDLALFLPTRNTTAQIWAAFNYGFPHYFLSASGPLAELVKSRECERCSARLCTWTLGRS